VLRLAGRAGAPGVGCIESGGARMQEGTAALAGYARIFREHVALSGKVPQISVICGASAGGGCATACPGAPAASAEQTTRRAVVNVRITNRRLPRARSACAHHDRPGGPQVIHHGP
jgi:phage tail tape-measure protein